MVNDTDAAATRSSPDLDAAAPPGTDSDGAGRTDRRCSHAIIIAVAFLFYCSALPMEGMEIVAIHVPSHEIARTRALMHPQRECCLSIILLFSLPLRSSASAAVDACPSNRSQLQSLCCPTSANAEGETNCALSRTKESPPFHPPARKFHPPPVNEERMKRQPSHCTRGKHTGKRHRKA